MSNARSFPDEAAGDTATRSVDLSGKAKRVGMYLGVALVIFLLGLIPMWVKAREAASQRDAAQRELHLSQMQGTLASAAIDARRGEYEPARQTASEFFTALRGQIDADGESALTAPQREATAPLLTRRDEVITLLARGDPAAAEQLSDIYVAYRRTLNEVQAK